MPRYQKFESISLQRGVMCEPESSGPATAATALRLRLFHDPHFVLGHRGRAGIAGGLGGAGTERPDHGLWRDGDRARAGSIWLNQVYPQTRGDPSVGIAASARATSGARIVVPALLAPRRGAPEQLHIAAAIPAAVHGHVPVILRWMVWGLSLAG